MKKIKMITTVMVLGTALLVLGGCGQSAAPAAAPAPATSQASDVKVFAGLGETSIFRQRGEVNTFTVVAADALFDQDGKILDVKFDSLEISSPNANAEHPGAPQFSGWIGQPGYMDGASNTVETATKEVADWKTKRERGDEAYGMNWSEQIDLYQDFMKGKTVAEVEAWFAKNTSDLNGKPLTAESTKPEDVEKYGKLTDAEKTALADVTSGASISLKDGHGDFIAALKKAFDNKEEITLK